MVLKGMRLRSVVISTMLPATLQNVADAEHPASARHTSSDGIEGERHTPRLNMVLPMSDMRNTGRRPSDWLSGPHSSDAAAMPNMYKLVPSCAMVCDAGRSFCIWFTPGE